VLLILALAAAGVAVIQQRAAQERQLVAIARQLIAQADAAQNTDPRTALQLGIAAQRIPVAVKSNETVDLTGLAVAGWVG
jgi:hypothetical protein